jgi:hypothetical protein
MSDTAYLLVWIELGLARHIGVFSEDQPTMIGKPGFWHTLGQARGEGYTEAREELRGQFSYLAKVYRGPIGDAIGWLGGGNWFAHIDWGDILRHADTAGRKAAIDYLVTTDDVAEMAVAVDYALNTSARAKALTDSHRPEEAAP